MSDTSYSGSCFCGEVSYNITGNLGVFQYCHCSKCRKLSGSAFAANLLVSPEHFAWTGGEELVQRFERDQDKHYATCFCSNCGSKLPWLSKSGKAVVVPAGGLDRPPPIKPNQSVFYGSRAEWYVSTCDIPSFEELPGKGVR